MKRRELRQAVALTACLVAPFALPAAASGNGGGGSEDMESLALQPARILAQQALAILRVNGNAEEASMRVDAALESDDPGDVDVAMLERADEAVDAGDAEGAIELLDMALSRPLGSETGKALHESGREFTPAFGAQEVVAIVAGALALLAGASMLVAGRRRPAG